MNALLLLLSSIQAYSNFTDDCSPNPCPLYQTCCPTSTPGVVGCFPVPNGVCCDDHVHCCPQNTVCNLDKGTCDNKISILIPLLFRKSETALIKLDAVTMKDINTVEVVYCPDGFKYCSDENTCCKLRTGEYWCCPYPSATCCSDGIHCCPSDSKCDPTSTHCVASL